MIQVTSIVTSSEVIESKVSSMVTTLDQTSQVITTVSTTETSTAFTSIQGTSSIHSATEVTQTSLPTSGGEKDAEGAGLLAGLALLLLI